MADEVCGGIPVVEQGVRFLFDRCVTVEQAGALRAALVSMVSDCAKRSIERMGGDPEKLREAIGKYYSHNPL